MTFVALWSLSYFAFGMVLLATAAVGAVSYFRPRGTAAILALFLALPIYWDFYGDPSFPQSLLGASVFLFVVALILADVDWVGALAGIWVGLLLGFPSIPLFVAPLVVLLAAYCSARSAVVASVMMSIFGAFWLAADSIGYTLPSQFDSATGVLFPSLSTLSSSPSFSSLFSFLLGPNWASGLSSSWVGVIFGYFPLYFLFATILGVAVVKYGRRFLPRIPLGPISMLLLLAIASFVSADLLFASVSSALGSAVLAFAFSVLYWGAKPLLAPRPRLSLSGLRSLLAPSAVVQAQQFAQTEGVVVEDRPGRSASMRESWDKTKGLDDVKDELMKAVMLPMKHKKEAEKFGVRPAKGILLYGPPGTGKTTLLRGLSSKLEMRYVEINPGEILSKWYGESEQKMKQVFDEALTSPPALLAIDEIDSIGKERGSTAGDDVTPRVLNVILMGMDRVGHGSEDVIVVATTNKPALLDKALLRPGRFDKVIYIGPPDEKGRAEIFRGYLGENPVVDPNIDYDRLAKLTERFTGADIEALVNKVLSGAFYDSIKQKESGARGQKAKDLGLPPPPPDYTPPPAPSQEGTITQGVLEDAIKGTRPTMTFSMLDEYERFRVEFQRERRIQKGWEAGIPDVRFADIGGMEQAKSELREAFELPLTKPELMQKLKIRPVKGVLLYGPPGNGKTLLAKAVATEVSANFFVASGAELAKAGAGEAAGKIKDLFNVAKDNTPAIIFIDEIDQIAPSRDNPMGVAFIPVTTQLLSELDGVKELQGVMLLAATNKPELIDAALLRANRLEKHVAIPNPDAKGREAILGVCLRGTELAQDESNSELARQTEGYSGADIQELVNEAKKAELRQALQGGSRTTLTKEDFAQALQSKARSSIRG